MADIRDCWEEAADDHGLAGLPLDERRYHGRRRIWTAVVSRLDAHDRDLMAIAASLRDMTTQLPADQYTPNSLTW
ncbi:MAG: hypothetical protein WA895_08445 [Streptosporangiaceae bacterium]